MNIPRTVFAAMAIAMGSTLAMAQGFHPPRIDVAAVLNVDAAKAAQVQSILDDGRNQMKSLREQNGSPGPTMPRAKRCTKRWSRSTRTRTRSSPPSSRRTRSQSSKPRCRAHRGPGHGTKGNPAVG